VQFQSTRFSCIIVTNNLNQINTEPQQTASKDSTRMTRTDSADEVKVDVERDERYWQQSEEQFQDAGDSVNIAALIGKRPHSIAV